MFSERGFVSDNAATVHPAVLEAIAAINHGHAIGYGHEQYSQEVQARVAALFGPRARAFFVWGGSAANLLCVRAACRPWDAVICASSAHLHVDECGAAEAIAGAKVLPVATEHGKLTPDAIEDVLGWVRDEHSPQPGLVSITQCTELGTVYTLEETAAIASLCRDHGLRLHLDGARLANAAAALDASLAELTVEVGVQLVSFGGTKNGLLGAEAVVIIDPELAEGFEFLRKQTLQLPSKMRYLTAQFDALLRDDLWLSNARHANAMASRLASALAGELRLTITHPVQTNAVFALLPEAARGALRERYPCDWDQRRGEVRWMCSWDTTEDDVDALAAAVRAALAREDAAAYVGG